MNRASKYRAAYVEHVRSKSIPIFQMRDDTRQYRATVDHDGATTLTVRDVDGTPVGAVVLPESVMIEFGLWTVHGYGEDVG